MFKIRLEYAGKVGYISRRLFQNRFGLTKLGKVVISESEALAETYSASEITKQGWFNYLMNKGIQIKLEKV